MYEANLGVVAGTYEFKTETTLPATAQQSLFFTFDSLDIDNVQELIHSPELASQNKIPYMIYSIGQSILSRMAYAFPVGFNIYSDFVYSIYELNPCRAELFWKNVMSISNELLVDIEAYDYHIVVNSPLIRAKSKLGLICPERSNVGSERARYNYHTIYPFTTRTICV